MAVVAEELLAGPIVRRVTTREVAVWVVLRRVATCALRLYAAPTGGAPLASVEVATVAIGEALHLGLLWLRLGPSELLQPNRVYAYDVTFDGDGLGALGLLEDGVIGGHAHKALGYVAGHRPTFVTPPLAAHELVLTHGSCRRPYAPGRDGLVALDQLLERGRIPSAEHPRPHYLFLTGDQIYADDVSPELLEVLSRTGADLIGRDELGRPIERVRVDVGDGASARTIAVPVDELHLPPGRRARLMTRAAGFTSSDSQSHAVGVGELVAHYLLSWSNVLWPAWRDTGDGSDWKRRFAERKADVLTYLEAWRERAREVDRRGPGSTFRTNLADRVRRLDGAALIPSRLRLIEAWARRPAAEWAQPPPLPASDTEAQTRLADWWSFWGAAAPTPTVAPVDEARHARELTQLRASPAADLEALANLLTPAWFAGCEHYKLAFDHGLPAGGPPELAAIALESDSVVGRLRQLRRFYEGLPYVRRALANVSCLMMFDDHEVTDDWNISMAWVARTGAKALGRDTIANALVAYGLCQDWGNLPARYAPVEPPAGEPRREQPHERLLRLAQALFRDGDRPRPAGPTVDARSQLEALFGLGAHEAPQLDWHWSLTDPSAAPYEILSIDNRTRRGYETREGSPSAVSRESLPAQLPTTGPAGSELTIVIAPLPPIGFAPIEELIQPIVNLIEEYRADPRFAEWRPRQDFPDVQVDYAYGRLGRDPEPWSFVPRSFEALLARLSSRRAVVFLSGDVHYAFSAQLTYWKGAAGGLVASTRFAQLTSSALQNQPGERETLLIHMAGAQQFGSIFTGPYDRLGWARADASGPPFDRARVSPRVRQLLEREPILVPSRALPDDVLEDLYQRRWPRAPEWAWRLTLAKDLRPDEVRYRELPSERHRWELPTADELARDLPLGMRRILDHHAWHATHGTPRRVLFLSNLGVVRFTAAPQLAVIHSLHSWDREGAGPGGGPAIPNRPWPEALMPAQAYTEHVISLDPGDERAPDQREVGRTEDPP
jgi:hypothetical protein